MDTMLHTECDKAYKFRKKWVSLQQMQWLHHRENRDTKALKRVYEQHDLKS